MCLSKERFESKMIPRFLADSMGVIDRVVRKCKLRFVGLIGRPMMRNSVSYGLRVRKPSTEILWLM